MKKCLLFALLFCCVANAHALTITVLPSESQLTVGDFFHVDIIADIAQSESVIGWGLDFSFDQTLLSLSAPPTINTALWRQIYAADGDGLAAALPSFLSPAVYGEDLLLATLTMEAIDAGFSSLGISYTASDRREGFSRKTGFVTNIQYIQAAVEVSAPTAPVPEPATIGLLGMGLMGLACVARKRKTRNL